MSPRMLRLVGLAVAGLVLVATWFLLVSPKRSEVAALREEQASQQDASAALRSRISLLKKQSEEIPAKQAELASIQQRIPTEAGMPSLVRAVNAIAVDTHVTVGALTPQAARPLAEVEQPAAAGDPEQPEATTSTAPSRRSGARKPASAAPTLEVIDVSLTVCGSFTEVRRFLSELEGMRRAVVVSALKVERGPCGASKDESDLTASLRAATFLTTPIGAASTASGSAASAAVDGAS